MKNKINITHTIKNITITQNTCSITFDKDIKNNILISGNSDQTDININIGSFDCNEFKLYHIFYNLMQNILGKYILQDYQPYYNGLPDDFINIENKEIICHSDNDATSYFKLRWINGTINLSVAKEKHLDTPLIQNIVTIASNHSQYGNYHNEFKSFYSQLSDYCVSFDKEKQKQKRLEK